ncbi:hypothetical protein V495_02394 [Pseudogymnoascus sp. VKM F-4514 (FW-929)]|nr:hypothetical protein V495_02394 [Pseudogymnoascus sp. VKM F-4514 (FW-929)]KFY51310.1 hypothetical protein V497_09231 [Pseudogymnoascus sp. VKM F-4516 (FW-969)]
MCLGHPVISPSHRNTGLAGVFKTLTGQKTNRGLPSSPYSPSSIPIATVQLAQQLNGPDTSRGAIYGGPSEYEELYERLKPDNALADRLAAADALRLAVSDYPLSGVTSIWYAAKDLISPENPADARRTGFELLTACVKHASATDLERKEYFNTLTAPLDPDDFHLQLAAVTELAKNGKDLSGFHYDAMSLLTRWLRMAFEAFERARKSPRQSSKSSQPKVPLGEETNIHQLFNLIVNVIKFSFNVSDDEETGALIDEIIYIAVHATFPNEIRACVRMLDAIVTYGAIPSVKLKDFVSILCSVHFMVRDIRREAWQTIGNLCRSHNGHTTIWILLDVLRHPDMNQKTQAVIREVRGSLSVLERIVGKGGEGGYPPVPFGLLMEALSMSLIVDQPKVDQDIMHLILSLFGEDEASLNSSILEEDWTKMFEIVSRCAVRALETSDGKVISKTNSSSSGSSTTDSSAHIATGIAQTFYELITRVEYLLLSMEAGEFIQRESCILFFSRVSVHIPDSCAKLVIRYYIDFRFCYPSDSNWEINIKTLLDAFFLNRNRQTETRLLALQAVTDVYDLVEMMEEYNDTDRKQNLVAGILSGLADENDLTVVHDIVAFAVTVCDTAEQDEFEFIIKQLHQCVNNDRLNSPLFPQAPRPSLQSSRSAGSLENHVPPSAPSGIITRGIIQIFMRTMDSSATKCLRAFDEILWIVRSSSCDTEARLSALRMLLRLRADWANRIFLTPFTEAEALAALLYRTPASLAKKQAADEAQPSRPTRTDEARGIRSTSSGQAYTTASAGRSASGVSRTLQRNHQMWMTPDPEALPEQLSDKASPILVSVDAEKPDIDDSTDSKPIERNYLKINIWLEIVIGLLQQGCDWELYSYILVHLPSQLANHSLFKGAIPQVKHLRGLLCEQIKNSSFYEPPVSSGLRKSDTAICLLQALTMVMSYHQHFSRSEEDDLVKSLIHGVGAWERAAKFCIHALSICCHELPASMKLVLGSILVKMSQIITQSHVAVHILEFLACLARLPDLYSNFRDEEYRTVFGICFRYLQYVRDQNSKAMSGRSSTVSSRPTTSNLDPSSASGDGTKADNSATNAANDLPQYVFTLAYHVITYWFLALRVSDRGSHVSWITKNLVWTDDSGKQQLDEQAEVTLDFMRRTAYADVDESKGDPVFSSKNHDEVLKSRWIMGQSVITVEQATRSGWAQITKRQASATSHYMIHQNYEAPRAHQILSPTDGVRDPSRPTKNCFLPSNLPVQLFAPTSSSMQPIHLPDDDMIKRAISSLDRTSTVDGHKVGIVYIGPGQKHEKEILPNISGSTDYMALLAGLGTLTRLQQATFNTQGLDRNNNTDGEFTICWRDRVTELVFHITTMMPTNLEHDPQCIGKKRHIGNDFVNIIFNNSGNPFNFNTFPSEFNYVNIVITPESRPSFVATRDRSSVDPNTSFYKVQVLSKEGFPEISPASETKILRLKALPDFIRLLALNASVFCLVWANRHGGEYISSWRSRYREIQRLREKYKNASSSTTSPPGTAPQGQAPSTTDSSRSVRDSFTTLRRTSVANFLTNINDHDRPARPPSTAESENESKHGQGDDENMVGQLDFSKWAS